MCVCVPGWGRGEERNDGTDRALCCNRTTLPSSTVGVGQFARSVLALGLLRVLEMQESRLRLRIIIIIRIIE